MIIFDYEVNEAIVIKNSKSDKLEGSLVFIYSDYSYEWDITIQQKANIF